MHEEKSESSSFEGMQINVVKKEENLPRLKHFLSIKCKLSGQRRLVHFGIWKDILFLVSLMPQVVCYGVKTVFLGHIRVIQSSLREWGGTGTTENWNREL